MIRHQYISLFLVLSIVVFSFGCMVGPDYHPPKTKVPENFGELNTPETVNSKPIVGQPDLSKWWTTIEDPVLHSLIERSVKANLDLRIAQARVREARAQRGVVAADLYPTINVGGSYTRQRISEGSFATGSTGAIQVEGDLYQAGFDASWEIDVFGGVRQKY